MNEITPCRMETVAMIKKWSFQMLDARDLFVGETIKNRTTGAEGAQRIPGCLVGNLQLSNKSLRLR